MIIETTQNLDFDRVELVESANFFGDAGELGDIVSEALSEMHNLTIGMARLEHKALTESNDALMEAGVKEFFAKAAETIKVWWNKFVEWLGSLYTRIKDVFIKRADWLSRNKGAIASVTAEQLGDYKANLGVNLLKSDFSGSAAASIAAAKAVVDGAGAVASQAEGKTFMERAKEKIVSSVKGVVAQHMAKRGMSGSIMDALVGTTAETQITPAIVGRLVKVAEDCFKASEQMKGAKIVADAALKSAAGLAKVDNAGDKDALNARLSALKSVGSTVQGVISGYMSAISAANGQAMPVLVQAAKKAGAAAAKNESTSVLDSFL